MGELQRTRDISIDLARIFAILLVVIGHSLWFSSLKYNLTAQLIFHFFFSSVSLFFFLSGYSLGLNVNSRSQETTNEMLRRVMKKLVLPLLLWILIYFIWTLIYYAIYPYVFGRTLQYTTLELLTRKYKGFHLWFIISLIFFYLVFWYLKQHDRYTESKYLIASFIVSLLFLCLQYLQYYDDAVYFLQFTPFPYTFFFVSGLWFYHKKEYLAEISRNSSKFTILSFGILVAGILLLVLETIYGPIGVSNVRLSIFVFTEGFILLFLKFNFTVLNKRGLHDVSMEQVKTNRIYASIVKLAQSIGGVYFIHIIVLDCLGIIFFQLGLPMQSLIVIGAIAVLNCLISFTTIIFLSWLRQLMFS